MKYFKRLNLWKGSTGRVSFNPETGEALSYDWYCIGRRIDGRMYVTRELYSNTTAKHVSKLRSLLSSLGIDYVSIQNTHDLSEGLETVNRDIELLEAQIERTKRADTKKRRQKQLKALRAERELVTKLIKTLERDAA